jgi:hypothetical protein
MRFKALQPVHGLAIYRQADALCQDYNSSRVTISAPNVAPQFLR